MAKATFLNVGIMLCTVMNAIPSAKGQLHTCSASLGVLPEIRCANCSVEDFPTSLVTNDTIDVDIVVQNDCRDENDSLVAAGLEYGTEFCINLAAKQDAHSFITVDHSFVHATGPKLVPHNGQAWCCPGMHGAAREHCYIYELNRSVDLTPGQMTLLHTFPAEIVSMPPNGERSGGLLIQIYTQSGAVRIRDNADCPNVRGGGLGSTPYFFAGSTTTITTTNTTTTATTKF